ncbi:hypothetical protein NEHOM01_0778 [Nematocida homosporus]|uniref:uncharacterized protein n=1 Tax=Nematocida homosporus TaxID=1912981 RepID=UPI00221F5EC4|nr:uncharacterized protein NEHOM01_0778 [Nematocida homosporus]KAI5185363.1 hypothetical protein NEHOM01_0778 [Nematocida homosporus]
MLPSKHKTSRRWLFLLLDEPSLSNIYHSFERSPKVRFSIWIYQTQNQATTGHGYIEMTTPVKMSGIRKILGGSALLEIAKRKRDDIIRGLSITTNPQLGPFTYGEQELKKGGRPKKAIITPQPTPEEESPLFAHVLTSFNNHPDPHLAQTQTSHQPHQLIN